jgi:hypothetical protein
MQRRIDEMKQILSIISVISILILFGPYSALSQSDGIDNLETKYGIYIDEYISKNLSKADMLRNTRSENLRKQALLYCFKAGFLKINKNQLTDNLIAYKVGLKPYQIQSFLNKKFFNNMRLTMKKKTFYSCVECGLEINLKTLRN